MLGKIYLKTNAKAPEYADEGASGADVFAYIENDVTFEPGERGLVPTGVHMEIPEGYEVQVRPRSGLALNQGLTVLNTPGTIDSSYRGEIKVILVNLGNETATITPGMRIAQLVSANVSRMRLSRVNKEEDLSTTERGSGGFGHTETKESKVG